MRTSDSRKLARPAPGRARADGVPLVEGVGELGQLTLARLDPRVGRGERTQPRRDRGAAAGPSRRRERGARAGQPVAHRHVGEHRERIVHERLWIGTALVAGRGLLGPPDRRQRLDERLDRHGIQPTDDRPPPRVDAPDSRTSVGRTRPRAARSSASSARARRCATEAP